MAGEFVGASLKVNGNSGTVSGDEIIDLREKGFQTTKTMRSYTC